MITMEAKYNFTSMQDEWERTREEFLQSINDVYAQFGGIHAQMDEIQVRRAILTCFSSCESLAKTDVWTDCPPNKTSNISKTALCCHGFSPHFVILKAWKWKGWKQITLLAFSLPSSKSTFSKHWEQCINEAVGICSIVIFHLNKIRKAKFFI